MSEYAYVDGWYQFPDEPALEEALEKLGEGGWLGDSLKEDEIVDRGTLKIEIPYGHYRNLHRHIDTVGYSAEEYHIISTSADGYFKGWVDTHDSMSEVDLEEWAAENGFDSRPDDFEKAVAWEMLVINQFVDENKVPPVEAGIVS